MATGDEEGGETESYTITSEQGLDYESTEKLSDIVFQIHTLVHGPKRDLAMIRSLTEDLWSIVAVNDENSLMLEDTLGDIDSLDQLPAGWTSEADEDDESE